MKISYLREFIVLAKCLNFTKASDQLFIAQPTLSKHIALMEEELGFRLLTRTKHTVNLTVSGHTFLEASQKIIATYDEMLSDISRLSTGQIGEIRLGMLYYGIDEFIMPAVASLANKIPNLKLSLASYQPKALMEDLWSDKLDVVEYFNIDQPGYDQLEFFDIGWQYFSVALPKNHHLAGRSEIKLSELDGENFIFQEQCPSLGNYIKQILTRKNVKIGKVILTEHVDTVSLTICATHAVSIVTRHTKAMHSTNISFVDIIDPNVRIMMAFAYKKNTLNPCITPFLDVVKNCFPTINYAPV
ncbi:LysR family transcriptional regulator [Sporomusa sp. KB1]|jgi:DNA-binding transcriptional LysR family regulator|uniref:LysR family transcriptional regulator n=1 Tax=Sporomusa sp. KB1 TaxID=943346 RepID=UPI0011A0F04E|nr:LysR family transcriptional regulator [Sporomusa sp. KB1]TWH46242.1 DNA-binding transcriptional LysR family regulator [Sporomusa sp. KB1]